MSFAGVIWALNLCIQSYVVWLTWTELRSPYSFPRWRWKWGLMLVAASFMLIRRLYNFLWNTVDLPWVTFKRTELELFIPLIITVCLALSLRQARRIYSPITPLAPAPPAIIIIDATSSVLFWNMQAVILFGYTPNEALGQPLPALIIPERYQERHVEGVRRWLALPPDQQRINVQYLTMAKHKAGHEFRVEVVITALEQQDGSVQFHGSVRKLIAV